MEFIKLVEESVPDFIDAEVSSHTEHTENGDERVVAKVTVWDGDKRYGFEIGEEIENDNPDELTTHMLVDSYRAVIEQAVRGSLENNE